MSSGLRMGSSISLHTTVRLLSELQGVPADVMLVRGPVQRPPTSS